LHIVVFLLQGFKKDQFKILITTDVAARGLDVPDVSLVVQTEPPKVRYSFLYFIQAQ